MTNQQHPITPPPEPLHQWATEYWGNPGNSIGESEKYIATQAARWGADQQLKLDADRIAQAYQAGADQELEACRQIAYDRGQPDTAAAFLRIRRPQLPPETLEVDGHTYRLVK